MSDSDQPQAPVTADPPQAAPEGDSSVGVAEPFRVAAPSGPTIVEKVILLVDSNPATRDSRARAMESRGLNIDVAANSGEALSRFSSGVYDLVLIDLGHRDRAERLAQELRETRPRQRVAFLVGGPKYVITSPIKKPLPRPSPAKASRGTVSFDFGQRVRDAEADKA